MKRLFILVLVCIPFLTYAQDEPVPDAVVTGTVNAVNWDMMDFGVANAVDRNAMLDPESRLQLVDGSPFLLQSWGTGKIDLIDREPVVYDKINYCIIVQQIWVKNKDGAVQAIVAPSKVKQITINDQVLVYRTLGDNLSIFEKMEAGKMELLKQYRSKYSPAVRATSGYEKPQKARFDTSVKFYYSPDSQDAKELPTKKVDFLKIFPENQDKMKAFIDKNKINLKKEKDLIKAFQYYNGLQ